MSITQLRYDTAYLLILIILGISACTTEPYDSINQPEFNSLALQQVLSNPDNFSGQSVRWGGTIAKVENHTDVTEIEIVEQTLDAQGRPRTNNRSAGRFIARFEGFLDPLIYASGQALTIVGTIASSRSGKIGAYPYVFPLLAVSEHRLWRKRETPQVIYYREPFFNDLWFYRFRHPHYHRPPHKP